MASPFQENEPELLQSQEEKHVNQMNPATPRSAKEHDNNISSTLPITPPTEEQVDTPQSSLSSWPDAITAPPTPSNSAPPSDRAISLPEIFQTCNKEAIREHEMQSHIFSETRSSFVFQANKILVTSSRGFERGLLPTRRTKPPLLKRRYSVDVNIIRDGEERYWSPNTFEVNKLQLHPHSTAWSTNVVQQEGLKLRFRETEPLPVLSHRTSLPHAGRYYAFASLFDAEVPNDDGVFLELGDVTLHNDAYNYIDATNFYWYGMEVWMRDESLDMALEVLRRDEDCDAHSIAIANSTMAQICHFAARQDSSPEEFVQYKPLYQNKKWIFVVVNDAIGGIESDGRTGSHWSLVALDRISRRGYYYDSMHIDSEFYQYLARDISLGMLKILDEDPTQWSYEIQFNSPNQNWHNTFKGDGGACGPFVFKMTQLLIDIIKYHQVHDSDENCGLTLAEPFAEEIFKPRFNSASVRLEIKANIARWRRIVSTSKLVNDYDYAAVWGADVILDEGPVVEFKVPPKRKIPILRRTRVMGRYSRSHQQGCRPSSGTSYHDPIKVDDSDENYVIHETSSDSGNSNAASSGGDTVLVGQESDSLWEISDPDTTMGDNEQVDVDGEVQDIDYPVHAQEIDEADHAPASRQVIMDLTEDTDEDDEEPVVARRVRRA
jgi:hypothetical protein